MKQIATIAYFKKVTLAAVVVSCLLLAVGIIYLLHVSGIVYEATPIVDYNARKRFEPTCNTKLFRQELRLDDDPPRIRTELLARCDKVHYNRIPKSASTTFQNVFDAMGPINNFTAIQLPAKWKMNEEVRAKFVKRLQPWLNASYILTTHYYFDSFEELFGDTGVYIQVIREPTDWFLSYLNWQKYGSEWKPWSRKGLGSMDIEACIYSEDCVTQKFNFAGALTFLCGQANFCRSGGEESYQQAVYNIKNYYLVIGLFEDLPAYVEVLEYLMPHIFFNITNVFLEQGKVYFEKTKTTHKDEVSDTALSVLQEKIAVTQRKLYELIKTRFYKMFNAVRRLKALSDQ